MEESGDDKEDAGKKSVDEGNDKDKDKDDEKEKKNKKKKDTDDDDDDDDDVSLLSSYVTDYHYLLLAAKNNSPKQRS